MNKSRLAWMFACKTFLIGTTHGDYWKWEYLYKVSNKYFTFTIYRLWRES